MNDQMDDGRDASQEWAHHELMLERERLAVEALNRCAAAGAKEEDLKTLAWQCGVDIKYLTLNADCRTASVG